MFAGVFSFGEPLAPLAAFGSELRQRLNRSSGRPAALVVGERFVLAHGSADQNTKECAFSDERRRVSVLDGEPLLDLAAAGSAGVDRGADLRTLHRAAVDVDCRPLAAANGDFRFVCIDPVAQRVTLATDKLGLRPIYYVRVGPRLFFSTALHVLEALPQVPKHTDFRGVAQLATLGYVPGVHTPYENIRKLDAAQTVILTAHETAARTYFAWDAIAPQPCDEPERIDRLHAAFDAAVHRRRTGAVEVAHLSGGLDSRCIVAALRAQGARVHTLNFAPHGSADAALGRLAAEQLGSQHFERTEGATDFWARLVAIHDDWQKQATELPVQPRRTWAGFDGELVLAPVNLTPGIAAQLRRGNTAGAIAEFLRREGAILPRRVIAADCRDELAHTTADAVSTEVARYRCADPARALHLFALLNESRGQLAPHFETADEHRLEFLMPFYDSAFIAFVLSQPLDIFMGHRLYHRWLSRFAGAAAVPWQTYPDHEPCPLPMPQNLRVQWDGWYTPAEERAERAALLAQAERDLASPAFPRHVLQRPLLRAACLLAHAGWWRYSYLFPMMQKFVRYCPTAPTAPVAAAAGEPAPGPASNVQRA